VPFLIRVKGKVKSKINVKGVGQECPTRTGRYGGCETKVPRVARDDNLPIEGTTFDWVATLGRRASFDDLGEFQAVGLVEQVPGFAVGGAGVAFAVAFGA
jgi:hypothetical protein